jgi:hypothetical protein
LTGFDVCNITDPELVDSTDLKTRNQIWIPFVPMAGLRCLHFSSPSPDQQVMTCQQIKQGIPSHFDLMLQ